MAGRLITAISREVQKVRDGMTAGVVLDPLFVLCLDKAQPRLVSGLPDGPVTHEAGARTSESSIGTSRST